jgi:hypothetical protein
MAKKSNSCSRAVQKGQKHISHTAKVEMSHLSCLLRHGEDNSSCDKEYSASYDNSSAKYPISREIEANCGSKESVAFDKSMRLIKSLNTAYAKVANEK